jgi:predicted RNA binding protein YcfA (HicA-like mRNA interferase family)
LAAIDKWINGVGRYDGHDAFGVICPNIASPLTVCSYAHIYAPRMASFETNSRKLMALLVSDGFALVAIQGSHHKLRKGDRVVVVPHPKKDLPLGTVRQIYKQAGWLRT